VIRLRALTLPFGTELLAVPGRVAREVVAATAVTPLPTAPPWVLGLFDLHGEILPALDAWLLLGKGRCEAPSHLAVVDSVRGAAGLASCGPPAMIELPDALGPAGLPATLGTARVTDAWGSEVEATVVDVEALLALACAPLGTR
jgi:purine-binding chemotaxis protein CheW